MNHYSRVCKSIQEIVEKVSAFDSEESDYQVDAVIGDNTKRTWKVDLDICNKMITFKIDTGADVTVIPLSTNNKLKLPELCHSSSNLSSPGGNLKTVGEFRAKTTYKGKRYSFKIAVVDQPMTNNLLSREVSVKLGLVKRVDSINKNVFGTNRSSQNKACYH